MSRCYWGPLLVLPYLLGFGFLQRPAPLTCLLPLVGAYPQAPRLFTLILPYSGVEPWIFVLLLTSISSLIYKDSLINFIAVLGCLVSILSELPDPETGLSASYAVVPYWAAKPELSGLLGYEAQLN